MFTCRYLVFDGVDVNLLSAVHQLAWTQHPVIWLCESCAILWLVVRVMRSPWVRAGVLLMLCGLTLNTLVTDANAGTMPVVGMPSTLHPASPMWRVATSKARLLFLADQARLGLFSVGDLVLMCGGILIIAVCLHRTLTMERNLACKWCAKASSIPGAVSTGRTFPRPSCWNNSKKLKKAKVSYDLAHAAHEPRTHPLIGKGDLTWK